MIRTLLFLSLLRWAACLVRGEWWPFSLKKDLPADDFNYTLNMEDAVLGDEEIRALPYEARTECESYSRTYLQHHSLEAQGADVSDLAGEDVGVNASLIQELGSDLKSACFGAKFDGEKCRKITWAMHYAVWPRLRAQTGSSPLFTHLRARAAPPTMMTFRMSGGVMTDLPCRHGRGNAPRVYYRHVYKSAGLAIKENLAILGKHDPETFKDTNWIDYDWCSSYVKEKQAGAVPKPVLFTFVRDPLEKFIAGYKEIASRGEVGDIRGTKVGTIEHAKLFLDNVFHGSCNNGHVLLQIQSMMGPACESRFDFIGRLEDFVPQWHELGAKAGCTDELPWPQEWSHASDNDDRGSDAAMRAALAENGGQLTQVLCLWLLPDFIAFDYPLPDPCKGQGLMQD